MLVGAHYDTKDIAGFRGRERRRVGHGRDASASRAELEPRTIRPTLQFVFFDGEESPADAADGEFAEKGLRGSKVAARRFADAVDRMVLLDFVGDEDLSIPREGILGPPDSGRACGPPPSARASRPPSPLGRPAPSSTTTSRSSSAAFRRST